MKTPTVGTNVFSPNTFTTNAVKQTTNFPVDMLMGGATAAGAQWACTITRLIGLNTTLTSAAGYPRLLTTNTTAELSGTNVYYGYDNTGFLSGGLTGSTPNVAWSFRRAPGFMDVVCYTGTGSITTQTHNLGVAPELVILKQRSAANGWRVMNGSFNGGVDPWGFRMELDTAGGIGAGSGVFNSTAPTASVFTLGTDVEVNASGGTYVAYLFATVAGVSKVGSYTGTGALQTINCGFTTGARFVLIKRTNSTGDWYVWDSARGISSSTDPYLLLNSTAAEVTGTNYVDTDTTGFKVTAAASTTVNISAATYIFLAIA
jgi:hypothetical protein